MEGHLDRPAPAPTATAAPGGFAALAAPGELTALAGAFGAALDAPDVRAARHLIGIALSGGTCPGRLYARVVRPALAGRQGAPTSPRARLAAGIGEAILADLVASRPSAPATGTGRAAVLSCRKAGIENVDGAVAMDFLESEGWRVARLHETIGGADPEDGPAFGSDATVELVVAVIAGPSDALRLAPVCTRLRRAADPPVIILCDFSGVPGTAASRSLGADDVVDDPEELLRSAARHLPDHGRRRWGVRLRRSGRTLVLSPTGTLDITSVGRLADVAQSRAGTFSRLVIDLRDLAALDAAGLRDLAAWPEQLELGGADLVSVAVPAVAGGAPDELAALRGAPRWLVVDQPPV